MLYTIVDFDTQCGENRHTDIANFATLIHTKKLIHCVAIFTILYGNYYPPHGEFKLICIRKFAKSTWMNFTQKYGKNRQRCQQNKFYYAVWQYCYIIIENFPQKFSPCRLYLNWRFRLYLISVQICIAGNFEFDDFRWQKLESVSASSLFWEGSIYEFWDTRYLCECQRPCYYSLATNIETTHEFSLSWPKLPRTTLQLYTKSQRAPSSI